MSTPGPTPATHAPQPGMSDAELDRLEALSAAATPGPWTARNMGGDGFDSANQTGWWWVWKADVEHYAGVLLVDQLPAPEMGTGNIGAARITVHDDGDTERRDAEFIAAAREAIPALIATVRAQNDPPGSSGLNPAAIRTDDDLMELADRIADLHHRLGVAQVIERETKFLIERYQFEGAVDRLPGETRAVEEARTVLLTELHQQFSPRTPQIVEGDAS